MILKMQPYNSKTKTGLSPSFFSRRNSPKAVWTESTLCCSNYFIDAAGKAGEEI